MEHRAQVTGQRDAQSRHRRVGLDPSRRRLDPGVDQAGVHGDGRLRGGGHGPPEHPQIPVDVVLGEKAVIRSGDDGEQRLIRLGEGGRVRGLRKDPEVLEDLAQGLDLGGERPGHVLDAAVSGDPEHEIGRMLGHLDLAAWHGLRVPTHREEQRPGPLEVVIHVATVPDGGGSTFGPPDGAIAPKRAEPV